MLNGRTQGEIRANFGRIWGEFREKAGAPTGHQPTLSRLMPAFCRMLALPWLYCGRIFVRRKYFHHKTPQNKN